MSANSITSPGVYDIPEDAYHADPCPEPSLSSSVAFKIIDESARHASAAHPRLNPKFAPKEATADMEFGKAFHSTLLGKGARIAPVDAKDYKPKAAKEARAEARASGLIPILRDRFAILHDMVQATHEQLATHVEGRLAFTDGKPERVVVWREGDVWCRAMVDWTPDQDGRYVDDAKSTAGSARPRNWIRSQLYAMGYDIQAAWYLRGLRAVGRKPVGFRFVIVENYPPFALSVVTLDPAAMALAERKVERALGIWRECMRTGVWPGYGQRMAWAEALPWDEKKFEEDVLMEAYAA